MRYNHMGIPTAEPMAGESYLPDYGFHCTDHESNPCGIQWMRYEPDCPLPEIVRTLPHVAFAVDDLEAALAGHEILIEPNCPSPGVRVAFVRIEGAPVEFMEFEESAEAQVREAEDRLKRAMLGSQVEELDRLLDPELDFTNHLGMVLGKEDDLEAHRSGIVEISALEISDRRIRILGDSAVVTVRVELSGSYQGTPASGTFRFTRVWARADDGEWRVVAGHSSVVA